MDKFLKAIANNFWYEWNPEARQLFDDFSPHIWSLAGRNPYRFLMLRAENPLHFERRFAELMTDKGYIERFEKVKASFYNYFNPSSTIVSERYPELQNKTIAYFSMEYGFETLKIYSGGLGILSGDHVRGASDMGIKMVAVGLFYLQGYYEQKVTEDGEMLVTYDSAVPVRGSVREYLPLEPLKKTGTLNDLLVRIPMGDREVYVKTWRARVGSAELLLLDTNVKENVVRDRHITRRLYASEKHYDEERRRRIEQEIILGIGGARVLHEAGYQPSAYHLNEGHVAFAAIEVARQRMTRDDISFSEAQKLTAKILGFTSHTPVQEGNERFQEQLARAYLVPYLNTFLTKEEQEFIFNCARNQANEFDMTKLSLLLSGVFRNGVSRLHGEVCRRMWGFVWGNPAKISVETVPIDSITNGVHLASWQAPEIKGLVEKVGSPENIDEINDAQLWRTHLYRKQRMIVEVRERAAYHLLRIGKNPETIQREAQSILDSEAFIIGFARRFAGYKRVTFFIEDEEKLFTFLENAFRTYGKPIHILFSGKPHPNNYPGREQIRHIYAVSKRLQERTKERNFKSQLLFIDGYDISLAKRLIGGVDIWLNNPIKPLEASGTSGMKAAINGVLNVSIADGWIAEGIKHGENGWIFGKGEEQSAVSDRNELFDLLEHTILPAYFERPDSSYIYSPRWVGMMKNSIRTMMQQFSMERMLTEYIEKMYLPAVRNAEAEMPQKLS